MLVAASGSLDGSGLLVAQCMRIQKKSDMIASDCLDEMITVRIMTHSTNTYINFQTIMSDFQNQNSLFRC